MLELMRKHAGSWMIKILLGAIAMAFALSFGVYSYYGQGQEVALKVNEEPITMSQVREEQGRLSEEMRRQLGEQFDQMAPLLNLKQRAVDSMVNRVLLFQAAAQMGIVVGNTEVAAKVATIEAFQQNGSFDLRTYQRMLSRSRMAPEDFEADLRSQLTMEKLSVLVAGSAQVTPLEVDNALSAALSEVKGVYKVFALEGYFVKQTADEKEVKAFYQAHPNQFRVPEKLVLDYVIFPLARYRDQTDVREEDVKDAYEMSRGRYAQTEKVRASHILFKLAENPAPAEEAAAKQKAEEVMALAKKEGADFAALAKKYSQGPTASRGGDLGSFGRGSMVPAFEELAFTLEPGQVGMVKTRFGWHVVKVFEHPKASVTAYEKVSGELREELVENRARQLAAAAAERTFDDVASGQTLADLASVEKLALNSTDPFIPGQPPAGLPGLKGLVQAQEGLLTGQPLQPLTFDNGAVLAVVKQRVASAIKPLKDVQEDVVLMVREQKAKQAAEKDAADLLAKIKAESDPQKALAAVEGAKQSDWLAADGLIEGLTGSPNLVAALFMRPKEVPVLTKPVPLGEDFGAAVLTDRKLPTPDEIASKRAGFLQQLLAQKRRTALQLFLDDLRSKAKIQVVANL